MEFKVFKNENSKILKEYWLTQSEWDALDKTTVQEGDIYHIVGTIDKGDLSADVNASLAKADSSLQKPTTTLAKESFVKVGIDGTQKFDDKVYATADSAKILEAKLNENIIKDPSKTYLVWKGSQFPNSTNTKFKASAGCTIDWGDGEVQTFYTDSTEVTTHTYSDGISYHLISLSNYVSIGYQAFEYCSGLTSVIIGNGVTSIKDQAFYGCSGLASVTIPDSVTSISNGTFSGCSELTSVTIPDSVTYIGNVAFKRCSKLKIIRVSATNPPTLGVNAFETSIEKIIVPKSAINDYKSAAGWSTYADKIVYEVDSSDLNSGGGKLYLHKIGISSNSSNVAITIHILSNKAEKFNINDVFGNYNKVIYQRVSDFGEGKFYENSGIGYVPGKNDIEITYFNTYPYDSANKTSFVFTEGSYKFNDTVTEF